MTAENEARHIAQCLELAILLEVSAHKPGNVSIVNNFQKTLYSHFLASAVASGSSFQAAAQRGILVSQGKLNVAEVGTGNLVKECVSNIKAWQNGGNTLLGSVILLTPIAIAAGMNPTAGNQNIEVLRKNLKLIIESTTPTDAVNMYAAISIATPSGLGKTSTLDINDPNSADKILEDKITLYNIFKIAEKYDTICSEWINNYPITFNLAYPNLNKRLQQKLDPNLATVQTFLEVLASTPDTFIARKTNMETSRQISLRAQQILDQGGTETPTGRKNLDTFDQELRQSGNLLNPGTTADIIAAALSLCILNGYRP